MTLSTIWSAAISLSLLGALAVPDISDSQTTPSDVQEFYQRLAGEWEGTNALWPHPSEAAINSTSIASAKFIAGDIYFQLTYTWESDSGQEEGVFLFGGKGEKPTASWGDTWHMATELLNCVGALSVDGQKLILRSSYRTGSETPDYFWRTEFTLTGPDAFIMEAYNITPEGLEAPAVRAVYSRK